MQLEIRPHTAPTSSCYSTPSSPVEGDPAMQLISAGTSSVRAARRPHRGFIAAGPDVLIVPIEPGSGAFTPAMVDMFKLDGGVKPTAELALGGTL